MPLTEAAKVARRLDRPQGAYGKFVANDCHFCGSERVVTRVRRLWDYGGELILETRCTWHRCEDFQEWLHNRTGHLRKGRPTRGGYPLTRLYHLKRYTEWLLAKHAPRRRYGKRSSR